MSWSGTGCSRDTIPPLYKAATSPWKQLSCQACFVSSRKWRKSSTSKILPLHLSTAHWAVHRYGVLFRTQHKLIAKEETEVDFVFRANVIYELRGLDLLVQWSRHAYLCLWCCLVKKMVFLAFQDASK